jgi:hypothetical protein
MALVFLSFVGSWWSWEFTPFPKLIDTSPTVLAGVGPYWVVLFLRYLDIPSVGGQLG